MERVGQTRTFITNAMKEFRILSLKATALSSFLSRTPLPGSSKNPHTHTQNPYSARGDKIEPLPRRVAVGRRRSLVNHNSASACPDKKGRKFPCLADAFRVAFKLMLGTFQSKSFFFQNL